MTPSPTTPLPAAVSSPAQTGTAPRRRHLNVAGAADLPVPPPPVLEGAGGNLATAAPFCDPQRPQGAAVALSILATDMADTSQRLAAMIARLKLQEDPS